MTTDNKISFVRLAWNINGHSGAGEWQDMSAKDSLEAWIEPMNAKYGTGSHRLEYDNGQQSHDTAQTIIKNLMVPKATV